MSYTTHDGNNNENFIVCSNTFFFAIVLGGEISDATQSSVILLCFINNDTWFTDIWLLWIFAHSLLLWSDMSLRRLQIKRCSTGWLLYAFYLSSFRCLFSLWKARVGLSLNVCDWHHCWRRAVVKLKAPIFTFNAINLIKNVRIGTHLLRLNTKIQQPNSTQLHVNTRCVSKN